MDSLAQARPTGNDRDFAHFFRILNPFRYVRTAAKAEFMDKLEWVLRVTTALCLIGHGYWGTILKPSWADLITPMGFSPRRRPARSSLGSGGAISCSGP